MADDETVVQRRARPARIGEAFPSLLTAAQSGGPWAFERLYEALGGPVAGYLRMQGAADAEDLANEVFFNVFTAIGTFTGDEAQFRSWVFTIAHRRLVDERRRSARRPPLSAHEAEDRADPGGGAEEEALRRLSVERVRTLCDRLAPDQRDVLLLRLVSGMTLEQTAEALGKTQTAVKALQRRAVGAVRRLVERSEVSL